MKSKVSKKINIRKVWNRMSRSYQNAHKIPTKNAHYGPGVPDENKLKLLGDIKGKKILEIGCGGGQCSIAFAKQGAIATGIDISDEQIKFAKELAKEEKVKVKFLRDDIENLKQIKSKSQNIVFSSFALQYIKNLKKCFKEVYRVLKNKGIFVFSLDHPFFDILADGKLVIERSYFDTGICKFDWFYNKKTKVKSFIILRKVSDIFNTLISCSFTVEKILEPKPSKDYLSAGDFSDHYPYRIIKMVPSTIIFKAIK